MLLNDWIPAFSTTALLAAALWLGRNLISARLTKSVEFEFSARLEALRSAQRKVEEELRAEIRAKEVQLDSLQSGALAALLSRQQAFDKRRLEAVDQLWAAVLGLAPARAVATFMLFVNWDAAAAEAKRSPETRQFFEILGQGFDPKKLDVSAAHKARPFITPVVWATYTAYSTLCMHGAVRNLALRSGLDAKVIEESSVVNKLILAVLPHYKDFIEEHGSLAYYHVFSALEDKLVLDMQNMLRGGEVDASAVAQAALIVKLAEAVTTGDTASAHNA